MENKLNKNNHAKKAFFIVAVLVLFIAAIMQASSEEIEKVRYTELEKQEISSEENAALKEYYGEMLGPAKEDAKFNNVATKDEIAILNVTIDGKDRRILTKVAKGNVVSTAQEIFGAITAKNITVLEKLEVLGKQIYSAVTSFGERNFYSVESSSPKYVDEGFSRLVNGNANVSINPVLRESISSYNVFLSAEGLTKGIYVAEKTNSYFIVKSVNSNSNVGFSWMLRGVKKDFEDKLVSEFGKEKGIGIKATIDFEKGITEVKINGANKILGLVNLTEGNNNSNNDKNNEKNNNSVTNETNGNQSITLITGNLIDEFGLETDLGQILGESAPLPELGEETPSTEEETTSSINEETTIEETTLDNTTTIDETITEETGIVNETTQEALGNATSNETIAANETVISVLEFTLYSTDEDYVISQIADVTSLSLSQVKKLINFVYLEPLGFEDEIIEPEIGRIDGIEKVNGSVIIRLG